MPLMCLSLSTPCLLLSAKIHLFALSIFIKIYHLKRGCLTPSFGYYSQFYSIYELTKANNICCLWSLLAFYYFKLYTLSVFQLFETIHVQSRKMYKYIFSFFIRNKSVTFFGIKPFYCSLLHKTFLLTHCSSLPQGLIYFFILAQFSMFVNEFHSPGAWFFAPGNPASCSLQMPRIALNDSDG